MKSKDLLIYLTVTGLILIVAVIFSIKPKSLPFVPQFPTPTPEVAIGKETANSKTESLGDGRIKYTSYDFGYEITYPDRFNLREYSGQNIEQVSIIFTAIPLNPSKAGGDLFQDGAMIKISYLPTVEPSGYYALLFEEIINKGENAIKEELENETAYKRSELIRLPGGFVYFIKKDDKNYYELWVKVIDPNNLGYQEEIDQILNSFKVLD